MRPALFALALLALSGGAAQACDPWLSTCPGGAIAGRTEAVRAGYAKGRPPGCPRLWCGCWLAMHLYGRNERRLWLARNWAREGRPAAGPAPGVIAVFARGRRGGHVGIVTAVPRPGVVVLLSGNDGRAVRERERTTRGVIAYRWAG